MILLSFLARLLLDSAKRFELERIIWFFIFIIRMESAVQTTGMLGGPLTSGNACGGVVSAICHVPRYNIAGFERLCGGRSPQVWDNQ